MNNHIRIGTSGFSFPDWRKGAVYPQELPKKEELFYYQNGLGFDCLEINATYYALVSDRTTRAIEQKTGPGFKFIVKGFHGITHGPFDNRLGTKQPSAGQGLEYIDRFKYTVSPFRLSGKPGAVLLQFPVFFYPGKRSEDYIIQYRMAMEDIPLVIEFRNSEWAVDRTFDFLKDNKLAYCAVNEPKIPRLMPLIKEMNGLASNTYIFLNNRHAGSAVKNAQRLKALLGKQGKLF
jgi:uncharacterized protein YecE (DUF72 family)